VLLSSPTQGGASASIANLLGFGGYHTIIGVKTTLTPTNFTTTVDSQWYYSGADSDKRELKDGNKNKKTKQQKSDAELKNQTISVSDQNQEQQNRCVNLIKTVQLNPEATNTLASGAEPQPQMGTAPPQQQLLGTPPPDTSSSGGGNNAPKPPFKDKPSVKTESMPPSDKTFTMYFVPTNEDGTRDETTVPASPIAIIYDEVKKTEGPGANITLEYLTKGKPTFTVIQERIFEPLRAEPRVVRAILKVSATGKEFAYAYPEAGDEETFGIDQFLQEEVT
jgi:hypothetical protein